MKRSPSPSGNIIEEDEHGKLTKKPKRDFTERINKLTVSLERNIEEHENSRVETQNKIKEVCDVLRAAVDNLERQLIDDLQQNYTKEESRLHESLHKLKIAEDSEEMGDEEKDKILREAESIMFWIQRYKLNHPKFEDVKKWANDTISSEFKLDVSRLLSDKLKERIPHITEVKEAGPNEVHIDLEFLNEYEKSELKRMKKDIIIEYTTEIWNGETGENYEVKDEQFLEYSHKAYIEWRHRGGSECKVRLKAVLFWLPEEEYESEWSEWKSFIAPEEHKNSGIAMTGIVWEKWKEDETYTVVDTTTNEILYSGAKRYTTLPDSTRGHRVQIKGQPPPVCVPLLARFAIAHLFEPVKEHCR